MKSTFRIAEISYGRAHWDCNYAFEYAGSHFEVQRFGVNFNVDAVKSLIYKLRSQVDAIALTSLPPVIRMDSKNYIHRQYLDIMRTPSAAPLCDGTGLKEIANLNSLISKIEAKEIDPSQGVFFTAATMNLELKELIQKCYAGKVFFGDAYSILGLPLVVQPFYGLKTISKGILNLANFKDLKKSTPLAENKFQKMSRNALAGQIEDIQYVCSDLPFLLLYDTVTEFLRGKDLITWTLHPQMEEEAQKYGPRSVINLFPEEFALSPYMNYSVLDAVIRLAQGRTSPLSIEEWEEVLKVPAERRQNIRRFVVAPKTSTQVKLSESARKLTSKIKKSKEPDFAFVVHALAHKDFTRVKGLGFLNNLPQNWSDSFDRGVSKLPPIVYGNINNIISSETGREVNGIVYGLFSTPKVLRESAPEITYRKIEKICYDAANRGAKIIGLGAYTKIIGDSGVTINKNSPIPVTTGNSFSASSTLWALREVVSKMRLVNLDKNTGMVDGVAMVIGATGSIGKVSAKLLALVFKKLYLVAPRAERLEDLKNEIQKISPHCQILISTDANEYVHEVDALVTATSAYDSKIVDVMRLKPGCVVCDCSRPLDFDKEDAKKRPDVLIIESGEVVLPGPVDMACDLGLPENSVYACLAETALLALEERYDTFTMGRDIEWEKVKEIYKMAKKHGIKLAAIQGHMGTVTDREIELTRQLALLRRASK